MGIFSKWVGIGSFRVACLAVLVALYASAPGRAKAGSPSVEAVSGAPASASTKSSARNPPNSQSEVRADLFAGPVHAEVLKVVDGDTLRVRAYIWIGQSVEVAVRIRGIDPPELNAGCAGEYTLALSAADFVRKAVSGGTVRLSAVNGGKYFGRVLADVTTADGRALGPELIAAGLARPYVGGRQSDWCAGTAGLP